MFLMMFLRLALVTACVGLLTLAMPAEASAAGSSKAKARAPLKLKRGPVKKSRPKLICKGSGRNRRCHRQKRSMIVNHSVKTDELRAAPIARPSGRVHVFVPSTGAEVEVNIYNDDGSYNQAALAALDQLWACRRTKEVRAVDPRLYEILSSLTDHFGKRVGLYSGFRFQQNEGSRHFHASAMDVRIDGVPFQDVYDFAETLDAGGMGIGRYPNLSFVHIDFRAPGQRSVRWTDTSRSSDGSDPGKQPSRSWVRKPNS
jgi:uncharacterized protein YcbK (DUF882 family)